MATYNVEWIDDIGKSTLYWFPLAQSLSTWADNKQLAVERSLPDQGIYDVILDSANGTEYALFDSATQPASWNLSVTTISTTQMESTTPTTTTPESGTVLAFSQAYGPKRVKTPNMEVEQFDPILISKALEREDVLNPSFADFGITIVSPNISKYRRRP